MSRLTFTINPNGTVFARCAKCDQNAEPVRQMPALDKGPGSLFIFACHGEQQAVTINDCQPLAGGLIYQATVFNQEATK